MADGMTTRELMTKLRTQRTEQMRTQLKQVGVKPKTVDAVVDGFNSGLQQAIADLIGMGVIELVEPSAADGENK